jgi:hypothetical protein
LSATTVVFALAGATELSLVQEETKPVVAANSAMMMNFFMFVCFGDVLDVLINYGIAYKN